MLLLLLLLLLLRRHMYRPQRYSVAANTNNALHTTGAQKPRPVIAIVLPAVDLEDIKSDDVGDWERCNIRNVRTEFQM